LEKKEAKHSVENADDRKNIEIAKTTYGDYKLKMSKNYVVPENQRINAAKKRQQMVLLEGSMHKLKVDFNKKVEELKIRKKDICEKVKSLNSRLTEINQELVITEELFVPQIHDDIEYPEKFFEVNEKDIKKFQKEKKKKEAAAKKGGGNMFESKKKQEVQEEPEKEDE
jgi:aspartate beta-hydroxylase